MPGIPYRKKAISLVAISTPGDVKTYPTGVYCVPAGIDQQVLASDSSNITGFNWQYVPDWNEASASLTGIKTLQFISGTLLNPPQSGSVEFDGTDLFYTTGSTRRNITAKPYICVMITGSSTTAGSTTSENLVIYDKVLTSSYMELSSSSRIKTSYPGLYNLQLSSQIANDDNNTPHQVGFWLKKNGSNISDTYSEFTVVGQHVGGNGHSIFAANFFVNLETTGTYIEVYWWADSLNVYLETLSGLTSPTRPTSPAIIVTVSKVD